MGHTGISFYKFPVIYYGGKILFIFAVLHNVFSMQENLFVPGNEYTYSYKATLSTGVLLPIKATSLWGLRGKLVVQAEQNSLLVQLQSLTMNMWNGDANVINEQGEYVDISNNVEDLLKPFKVTHKMGLVENFSVEIESIWATNIKRSIAGILQLDLVNLENQVAYHSVEINHYGQCTIEYVVIPESNNEMIIRKSVDPRTCHGHQHWTWSNVPRMQCPNSDQNPVLKSSERLYRMKLDNHGKTISFINATGRIYVQPFRGLGEAQFLFTQQVFELMSLNSTKDKIFAKKLHATTLQHELPESDLTQGRGIPDQSTILQSIEILLDRLRQHLETPGLDIEVDNLHNSTISLLLYYLGMLERADLHITYNKISGTSYKEETIRNMFVEALPLVGSKEAALFILDLIQLKKVSDIAAIQLLMHLPFHIRKPDVQLLVSLQPLVNLPNNIASEVQNTGILTYGTLIYKTCLLYCPYEMLDDYVRLYLDKFTESKQYKKKMVWLEGLANIQLGRVVEFLEPIASSNSVESRHLRFLAAWASLPTAPLRPDVIYPVYWPILVNHTEYFEMRIAALALLIISNPSPSRLISLYWYIQGEPNQHLYNFFYTTFKSMERTNFPCYTHIGGIAAQFIRVLRKPASNQHITTGNYLFDYQDIYRHFGAMLQGIVIANPLTNVPTVLYVVLNNHGINTNLNHVSLYIKAEGIFNSLSIYPHNSTRIKDILEQFKLIQKKNKPVHMEIIIHVQEKAVLCLHLNQTNIIKTFKYLTSLVDNVYYIYQNMEFHVNQQRINVPLIMESMQVTDFGTNARLRIMITSLFSMRGNFTHTAIGRNNHVILRTSILGTESIESYNPLTDLWYGAERAQGIHGYLPINMTLGFVEKYFISYITPAEYIKTGVMAHVRTSTNIRGINVKSKLKSLCSTCPTIYTVRQSPLNKLKDMSLLEIKIPELDGQLYAKVFDCENQIFNQDNLMDNILSSHRSNYQTWPTVRSGMVGFHFLDYFTYVSPGGSCGLAAYIEPFSLRSTEVKFEYVRNGRHNILSLTRRELETSTILEQWNVAIFYEATNWISETLKIKATKIVPGEKIMKICVDSERDYLGPWEWDFLSIKPSDPPSIKLNIIWGPSDTAKGKCSGSSLLLNLVGEISEEQIKESTENKWPYHECREQSRGKQHIPYTEACYEASKELSTLRKYQIFVKYENIPEKLVKAAWKLRAFYDLIGGNSSNVINSDQFVVTALFPKESSTGKLHLNKDKTAIIYDSSFIDFFLKRTRLHKYTDSPLFQSFFSTCILTPATVRSVYNVTAPLQKDREILILGKCHDGSPEFALSAINSPFGITIILYDESDNIKIAPDENGGAVYNYTTYLPIKRNFEFHNVNFKRVRLDNKLVELFFVDIFLFMHWTQEQVLLFYPNYVREFTCGICATQNSNTVELYTNN